MATFRMVLHPEKDSVVYHRSPVERLDAALSDQFPFREAVVNKYLKLFNASDDYTYRLVKLFRDSQEDQYDLHALGDYALIEDTGYITEYPLIRDLDQDVLRARAEQIERIHNMYPDMYFYAYYVTQGYDTSWFDDYLGVSVPDRYQQLTDALPEYVHTDHLVYSDLQDYMNIHYMTDHHWNHRGAYRGYENIYAMMSEDIDLGPMRIPLSENNVSETYDFGYLGSYGRALEDLYNGDYDEFIFYEFDLPDTEGAVLDPDTLEEIPVVEIGLYDEYRRGEIKTDIGTKHYIVMYGSAVDSDGKIYNDRAVSFVIRNSDGNGMNLLLVGDSNTRAIRDVLASHFDTTVYVDYRLLALFQIDYLIERYDIDALVMDGQSSYWDSEAYLFTFTEDE